MKLFTLLAMLCLVPAGVMAQSSVTLRGTVSETVTLSVAPTFAASNVQLLSSRDNTVMVTVAVDHPDDSVIRLPLLVRSNTSFKISATLDPTGVELQVIDVHPTGNLVANGVVNNLEVKPKANVAQPLLVTGPRVSLGGTLTSPNNALQITVLIHLKPQSAPGLVHLTFVATARSLTP